jgi:hypothetical protein
LVPKNLPTFLGIGAQRAGTSWLYNQLLKHPEVWMPPVKEIHFFDRALSYPSPNDLATASPYNRIFGSKLWERPRTVAGVKKIYELVMTGRFHQAIWWTKWTFGYYNDNWYRGLFSQAKFHKACGEITPSYSLLDDDDIAKIKTINPHMKIIFIIRNPIERAWSAIRFHILKGANLKPDSPEKIISVLKHPGMSLRGDYERILDKYMKFFDSSHVLICFFDAIKNDPTGLMLQITKFIGIKPYEKIVVNNKIPINPSPDYDMPLMVRDYLYTIYIPTIKRMAEKFGSYAKTWDGENICEITQTRENINNELLPAIHP